MSLVGTFRRRRKLPTTISYPTLFAHLSTVLPGTPPLPFLVPLPGNKLVATADGGKTTYLGSSTSYLDLVEAQEDKETDSGGIEVSFLSHFTMPHVRSFLKLALHVSP